MAIRAKAVDRLLIVVDQFEEIFTQTPEEQRQGFIEALLDLPARSQARIVLTLRADFYAAALQISRTLSDHLQEAQVNLGSMTQGELRAAIEGPARAAGLEFEPGLVERLLADVADEPGGLPLLEYALTQLWRQSDRRTLTNQRYNDMNGVAGAVSATADGVFDALSAERQRHARQLFGRLVRVSPADEANNDTRRRVRMGELSLEAQAVAADFAGPEARLLVMSSDVAGEQTVEVAHEALLRNWGRLGEWIATEREFLLWRQRLRTRCDSWLASRRRDSTDFLRGAGLAEALVRRRARRGDLGQDELDFIAASRRRARRPLMAFAGVAAAALLGACGWGGWELYRDTDAYQVARVFRESERLLANTGDQADGEWGKALALSGRYEEAMSIVRKKDSMSEDYTRAMVKIISYSMMIGGYRSYEYDLGHLYSGAKRHDAGIVSDILGLSGLIDRKRGGENYSSFCVSILIQLVKMMVLIGML